MQEVETKAEESPCGSKLLQGLELKDRSLGSRVKGLGFGLRVGGQLREYFLDSCGSVHCGFWHHDEGSDYLQHKDATFLRLHAVSRQKHQTYKPETVHQPTPDRHSVIPVKTCEYIVPLTR